MDPRSGRQWRQLVDVSGQTVVVPDDRQTILSQSPLYVLTPGSEADTSWVSAMVSAITAADPWLSQNPQSNLTDHFIVTPDADWATEGERSSPGFVDAAGEALATTIMSFITLGANGQVVSQPRIHMIGLGIGADVNNEAARRLQYYASGISIAQMTLLDPIDYAPPQTSGSAGSSQPLPFIPPGLSRILIPTNVQWSDVYYAQSLSSGQSTQLNGDPVGQYPGEATSFQNLAHYANVNLSNVGMGSVQAVVNYGDIASWYLGTITVDDSLWKETGLVSAEKITIAERFGWYDTKAIALNPTDGEAEHGSGGGLGVGWYWSAAGAGFDSRPYDGECPSSSLAATPPNWNLWNVTASTTPANLTLANYTDPNDDLSLFNGNFEYPLNAATGGQANLPTVLPGFVNQNWPSSWGPPVNIGDDINGTQGKVLRFFTTGLDSTVVHQMIYVRANNPVLSFEYRPQLSSEPPTDLALDVWAKGPAAGADWVLINGIPFYDLWTANNLWTQSTTVPATTLWTQFNVDMSSFLNSIGESTGGFLSLKLTLDGSLPGGTGSSWVDVDDVNFDLRVGDAVNTVQSIQVYTDAQNGGPSSTQITDSSYIASHGSTELNRLGVVIAGPWTSSDGNTWWKVDFGPGDYAGWVDGAFLKEAVIPYARGIDVSDNQSITNWSAAYSAGITFAYVKATEGDTPQPGFVQRTDGAISAGLIVGAYHYATPFFNNGLFNGYDAVSEADEFLSVAGSYIGPGYLQPALDLEPELLDPLLNLTFVQVLPGAEFRQSPDVSSATTFTSSAIGEDLGGRAEVDNYQWDSISFGQGAASSGWVRTDQLSRITVADALTAWVTTWITTVAGGNPNIQPIVYVTPGYAKTNWLALNPSQVGLWLATKRTDLDETPAATQIWGNSWSFWQFTAYEPNQQPDDGLTVPGIGGRQDGDVFNGSLNDLRRWTILGKYNVPTLNDVQTSNLADSTSGPLVSLQFPIGAVVTFDFDDVDPVATTPLTVTSGGVTAAVSANTLSGPGEFSTVPASSLLLVATSDNVLFEPSGLTGSSIKISFSEPAVQLDSLYFATKDSRPVGDDVTLQAYLGSQLVGTVHTQGTVAQGGLYTEGNFSFYGGLFDSLVISVSPGQDLSELAIGSFEIALLPDNVAFPLILDQPIGKQGMIDQPSVTVTGQLEDFAPLGPSVSYVLDGKCSGSVPVILGSGSSFGQFSIDLNGLAEGQHTLVVQANDEAGNTSQNTLTFTVDLTDPTLVINPIGLGGLIGSSTLTVTGTVNDSVLVGDTVLSSLDGGSQTSTLVVRSVGGTSASFAIALASLTPGDHSLTIQGFDQAGNSVESVVTFTYDATPPAVSSTIGQDGFTNQPNPILTGTVSDVHGVSNLIQYALDGSTAVAIALDRNEDQTEGAFAISASSLSAGPHTLQVTATDVVGNTTTQTLTFLVDLTAPTLLVDPIGTQGYVSRVPITGTFADNQRLYSSFQYAFDGGTFAEKPLTLNTDATTGTFQISTTGLTDGTHTLSIVGRDQAGNTVEESKSFIVDTVGPRPAQFTPSGTILGGPSELDVVLADDRIVPDHVTDASNWVLQASGGDAVFGDANSYVIPLSDDQIAYNAATRTVRITLPAPLAADFYRLTINGSGPDVVRDLAGNPFNDGADFVHPFVILDPPAVATKPNVAFNAGTQPIDVIVSDLNGDGLGDVVAVDQATGALTVAMNKDGQQWRSIQTVNLGVGRIDGIAAGDYNGDGKPDLLMQGPTSIFLAIGDGNGSFTLARTITPATLGELPGRGRIGILAADVNGDGKLDAVVLAPSANQVLVFPGAGNGTFGAPQAFPTGGQGPVDLALGQFIGDSAPDLAILNQTSGTVTFLQGDGQGTFTLAAPFTVGGFAGATSLKSADFNTDGRTDLALAAGANVYVLMNTLSAFQVVPLINGSFDDGLDGWTTETAPAGSGVNAGGVQVIDGVAVLQEGNSGRVTLSQKLVIPAGATALSFDLVGNGLDADVPGFLPDAFEVSLLDGSGRSLLPTIGADLTAYANLASDGRTLLGDGVTIAGNHVSLDLSALSSDTSATLYLDLVTTGPSMGSTVSVDNFAVLVPPEITQQFVAGAMAGPFTATHSVAVGDVNGDGRTDLLVTDGAGRLVVYSGDNQGGFARTAIDTTSLGNGPMALAAGKLGGGAADGIVYSLLDSGKIVSPLQLPQQPQQQDVTSLVKVTYYGAQYNRVTKTTSFYGTVTNISSQPLTGPIYLAWSNLSPSTLSTWKPDGTLANGFSYFDITGLTDGGILQPGATTTPRIFSIYNPSAARYSFDTEVLAIPAKASDISASSSDAPISTATVSLSATQVDGGSSITAVVSGGPGGLGDWAGLFPVGAPDQHYLEWSYLDGSHTVPTTAPDRCDPGIPDRARLRTV